MSKPIYLVQTNNISETECPDWCLKGQCVEKSSWTDENSATDCKACQEHYFLSGTTCTGKSLLSFSASLHLKHSLFYRMFKRL